MGENCTYGSMRDILRAEGESRSDALAEVRAYPITRGVPLYSTPFVHFDSNIQTFKHFFPSHLDWQ